MSPKRKRPLVDASARVVLTRAVCGIAHMQVCATKDATDEEVLAFCNRANPAGTQHGWSHVCREDSEFWGKTAPVACGDNPERLHLIVAC